MRWRSAGAASAWVSSSSAMAHRDVDQLMTAVSAEVSHSQPVVSGRPAGRPDRVVSVVAHFGMARSAEARVLA